MEKKKNSYKSNDRSNKTVCFNRDDFIRFGISRKKLNYEMGAGDRRYIGINVFRPLNEWL